MKDVARFAGLSLTRKDRAALRAMKSKGVMSARQWKRVQVLLLLDKGHSVRATAVAVESYPREVSRVGKRYLAGGLEAALGEKPRTGAPRLLDSPQEAAIVALVCGPPPEGRGRWTTAVIAEEVVRRGIAPKIGREKVRLVLVTHDLKPWREKNVVRTADRRSVRPLHGRRAAAVRPPIPTE
jgi:hypothetical protein